MRSAKSNFKEAGPGKSSPTDRPRSAKIIGRWHFENVCPDRHGQGSLSPTSFVFTLISTKEHCFVTVSVLLDRSLIQQQPEIHSRGPNVRFVSILCLAFLAPADLTVVC